MLRVSIVIAGFGLREASWDRLRGCVDAIASQAIPGVEVILVDNAGLRGEVSSDLREMGPVLTCVPCADTDPWARKDAGARAAAAPLIAFLDGDCFPRPGWLAGILETFEFFPEVAVLRGESRWWNFGGAVGSVRSTAANNVVFRREAYLDCPFPIGSGSKAVELQSARMRRAGYILWQQPSMQVLRDRRGVPAVKQTGYSAISSALSKQL